MNCVNIWFVTNFNLREYARTGEENELEMEAEWIYKYCFVESTISKQVGAETAHATAVIDILMLNFWLSSRLQM